MKYISATINKSIYIIRSDNPTIKLDIYADAGHLTHHDMKGHEMVIQESYLPSMIISLSQYPKSNLSFQNHLVNLSCMQHTLVVY